METNKEQIYYNELAKKFDSVAKDIFTKLNYGIITLINSDIEKYMPESKMEILKESKLYEIKKGFLRSYKLIAENPNFKEEDKERIFKKMVKSYFKICMKYINRVDIIVNTVSKKEDQIKLIRKYKHYE